MGSNMAAPGGALLRPDVPGGNGPGKPRSPWTRALVPITKVNGPRGHLRDATAHRDQGMRGTDHPPCRVISRFSNRTACLNQRPIVGRVNEVEIAGQVLAMVRPARGGESALVRTY